QVQFRLRGRLDAQGPRHLPRGGEAQRREAAGDAARERLLRRDLEERRQSLRHLVPDHAALTMAINVRLRLAALGLVVAACGGIAPRERALDRIDTIV